MTRSTFFKTGITATFVSFILIGCSQNEASSPVASGGFDDAVALSRQAPSDVMQIRLQAKLSGSKQNPLASGNAKWEKRARRLKFSVEVEDVKSSGKHEVLVDGITVGTVMVKDGIGDLNLDTEFGQRVPQMKAGQRVHVLNPSGIIILNGTLSAQ